MDFKDSFYDFFYSKYLQNGHIDVGDRNIMLATFFGMLVIFSMYEINHQHLKLVTNTFALQHPSPTSI